jgi:hypothetical protein
VPRIASNCKKVRFGEVVVPKQISVLRCKIRENSQNVVLDNFLNEEGFEIVSLA